MTKIRTSNNLDHCRLYLHCRVQSRGGQHKARQVKISGRRRTFKLKINQCRRSKFKIFYNNILQIGSFLLVSKLCYLCYVYLITNLLYYILFYFKVTFFKNTMAREGLFSFNLARKELFSVNLTRRLEKLPTPGVDDDLQKLNIYF